ncbi:LysR family transcriptional regulator [Paraburkholderia sp. BCC1885]|uniref:LysR family transcriptional regulator n=1 Tax=Paraburkholderia sp. BCC1885 TaxID=2562669 RepID=UPI0011841FAB|nr:LysR family transcriptional regulator [Paraburkholderia sp. BCC1885]
MDRLTAMETFASVVETGSFSAAARKLGIGQPAVSKTVAVLEQRLGTRLLLRSSRGLTPTDAGLQFYERIKQVIQDADAAELSVSANSSDLSGRLRICAPVTFARLHLVPVIDSFLDVHPNIELDMILDDRRVDLQEEGVDVALRTGDLSDSSMTARKLGECKRLVVGTPEYFSRNPEPLTPADLANHQAIVFDHRGSTHTWLFQRGASEVTATVAGRLRISSGEGVRAAVLSGLGLSISSEWMFAHELANGQLTAALTDWNLPSMSMWAVYPSGKMVSAKARAFVAFTEAIIKGLGSSL